MTRPYALIFTGPGRTKQSFRNECDINCMMSTYQSSGKMPAINPRMAEFQDFSQVPDFHSALNQVKETEANFAALPSDLRSHFDNDPGKLLNFLTDPDNLEEAQALGLAPPTPPIAAEEDLPPSKPAIEPTDPPQKGSEEAK